MTESILEKKAKILIPTHLTIEDVIAVSDNWTKVAISKIGEERIISARKRLTEFLNTGKVIYGVNTGFGALVDKSISKEAYNKLQMNLIRSHALGAGSFLPKEVVRAAMFLRANMLAKGYSGVRLELVQLLVEMLNRNVVPVVYEKGSVGASGDLAPLAFVALVLIGRGKAFYQDRIVNGKSALQKAGLSPLTLQAKEGLSLINGTEMMAGLGVFNLKEASFLADLADIAGALSFVALGGNLQALDKRLAQLKPYPGQKITTQNLNRLLKSINNSSSVIQNAYSLRCLPQVHGAVRETQRFVRSIVETEINSVTDNPIILDNGIIAGGNFHGATIAIAMDNLAITSCILGGIAERRIARLMDPKLSNLAPFLTPKPGINSGLMMTQILATTLQTENKILSTPASIHSLPTSANQEDFVSMGMDSALKARKVIENTKTILALELICACQAIELAKVRLNKNLNRYFEFIRRVVPFQKNDQELTQPLKRLLQNIEAILKV
ncbi:MAG: histidine ammonia-lyase [candidate division WOR-3 bacterium]